MRIQMVLVAAEDQQTLAIAEHCILDESDFELAVVVRQSINVQARRNAVRERVVLPPKPDSEVRISEVGLPPKPDGEVRITEVVTVVTLAVPIKDEL
jgi:ribosomal protein L1